MASSAASCQTAASACSTGSCPSASFPVGIDVADFAKAKRDSGLVQGTRRRCIASSASTASTTPRACRRSSRPSAGSWRSIRSISAQVVLTQIAPPTRDSVEAYLDIRQQLETLAGSINGRFGELDWVPIHYIHRSTPRRRLAGIYRSSRIGMVTPLRDGMNLVAKEYVAAQDADGSRRAHSVAVCRRRGGDERRR